MITIYDTVDVPQQILDHADTIKMENYKTNTPVTFQKHMDMSSHGEQFVRNLAQVINEPSEDIDWVFFSVCLGAEPHVDQLDPDKFGDTTFVIPIILPQGTSTITAEDDSAAVELFKVYQFDHTKIHSMVLEDHTSGCVVIMAALLK